MRCAHARMTSVRGVHTARTLTADLGLAALVVLVALWVDPVDNGAGLVPVLVAAAAAGLARRYPPAGLALIWLAASAQVLADGPAVATGVAVIAVGYRCGRYAGQVTAWLAGLSIPFGAVAALVLTVRYPERVSSTVGSLVRLSGLGVGGGFVVLALVLGSPFAVGLLVRTDERYRVSRAERELAEAHAAIEHDIAQSRAKQTQLARDVHDVVGHSLAVIIAQADSARLAAADAGTRETLAQIAAVGRSSLADVRDVLQRTEVVADPPARPELDPDELVAGVRSAGYEVRETASGEPRPGSGDTTYRVLQELLTNALKHGSGGAVDVEREWTADGLTLRVTNPVASDTTASADGMGLTGIRGRVDAAGGTFRTVIAGGGTDRARFVATTYLPVP